MTIKTTSDKAAVVDTGHHWIPISQTKPPRGSKVQLINRKRGVAVYGDWYPGSEWTHWQALPTFNKNDKTGL